jgi:hypothetical protein
VSQVPRGLQGTHEYALGRRFIITEKGYIGLAPTERQEVDEIFVLFGGDVPFVLRGVTEMLRSLSLVGEARALVTMDWEVVQLLDGEDVESRKFRIV